MYDKYLSVHKPFRDVIISSSAPVLCTVLSTFSNETHRMTLTLRVWRWQCIGISALLHRAQLVRVALPLTTDYRGDND